MQVKTAMHNQDSFVKGTIGVARQVILGYVAEQEDLERFSVPGMVFFSDSEYRRIGFVEFLPPSLDEVSFADYGYEFDSFVFGILGDAPNYFAALVDGAKDTPEGESVDAALLVVFTPEGSYALDMEYGGQEGGWVATPAQIEVEDITGPLRRRFVAMEKVYKQGLKTLTPPKHDLNIDPEIK